MNYLVNADGTPLREEWVTCRDLPGARHHEPAFVADVENPLSRGLSGRLEEFQRWSQRKALGGGYTWGRGRGLGCAPPPTAPGCLQRKGRGVTGYRTRALRRHRARLSPTEDLSVPAEIAAVRISAEVGALRG